MRRVAIVCSIVIVAGVAARVSADVPSEWDWRDHGGVSSVKSQGNCGSDWALATVEALESRIMIETGVELDLSEQYVLNCTSGGCDGGAPAEALNFLRNEGTVAESIVPYVAEVQTCDPVSGTRYTIDVWSYVGEEPWLVKQALLDRGPLVIFTHIYSDFFDYSSGVYDHATGSRVGGHAMLLVGYSDSGQYWIVKNSWGTWWGEDGFIRIAYADTDTMPLETSYSLGPLEINDDCEDSDGDGFGLNGDPSCPGGEEPDCDDDDPDTYPGADELCDGLDNDCDGAVPEDEIDGDGDGFPACAGDCDDDDPDTYPGADELCDGLDNDCDGTVPDDEADDDGDGYRECEGDCDDEEPTTYPGADELCDGLDNDCDGTVPGDEADADGDGSMICAGDCDDAVPSVHPAAAEVYDGVDNNCDGAVDEGLDDDGDGIPDFNDLCGDTPAGVGVGPDGCTVCLVSSDADGDGIADEADLCPASDLSPVVVIDGCDTGVANHLSADGCTILDGIAACAAAAGNHGQMASCVSHLTNQLKRDGVISGAEKGTIQACLK